jgi:hypothetical protein
MNIYKEFIIKYAVAEKEEPEFIESLIDQCYAVMQNMLSRKLDYAEYDEIHRITRYGEIFIDETPIDIAEPIEIWLLDSMQGQDYELTDYNISPKKTYLIVGNSGASEDFYKINLEFFGNPHFVEVTYTGGIEDLPDDLTLLLAMITKFFYTNRDPGVRKYTAQQLTVEIGDLNPQVKSIIGAWKCHHL